MVGVGKGVRQAAHPEVQRGPALPPSISLQTAQSWGARCGRAQPWRAVSEQLLAGAGGMPTSGEQAGSPAWWPLAPCPAPHLVQCSFRAQPCPWSCAAGGEPNLDVAINASIVVICPMPCTIPASCSSARGAIAAWVLKQDLGLAATSPILQKLTSGIHRQLPAGAHGMLTSGDPAQTPIWLLLVPCPGLCQHDCTSAAP